MAIGCSSEAALALGVRGLIFPKGRHHRHHQRGGDVALGIYIGPSALSFCVAFTQEFRYGLAEVHGDTLASSAAHAAGLHGRSNILAIAQTHGGNIVASVVNTAFADSGLAISAWA